MLRAVLLGMLCLSTVGACKSGTDTGTAASQPGVAAGKVVEVKGTVEVEHGGARRALASGDAVEGDDTVITGADGTVAIVLAHNAARWELGPGKQMKVRESVAWKAAKADGPAQQVDQDTAAAGRPGERNAAGTVAAAAEEKAASDEAPQGVMAPEPEAAPASTAPASPPPPPPPKPSVATADRADSGGASDRRREEAARKDTAGLGLSGTGPGGGGGGGGGVTGGLGSIGTIGHGGGKGASQGYGVKAKRSAPASDATVEALVKQRIGKLRTCVAGKLTAPVKLKVTVAGGELTLAYDHQPEASITTCIERTLRTVTWGEDGTYTHMLRP